MLKLHQLSLRSTSGYEFSYAAHHLGVLNDDEIIDPSDTVWYWYDTGVPVSDAELAQLEAERIARWEQIFRAYEAGETWAIDLLSAASDINESDAEELNRNLRNAGVRAVNCTASTYRVQYYVWTGDPLPLHNLQATQRCFTGSGRGYFGPALHPIVEVAGVCPGNNSGRIRWVTSWHTVNWSVWRSPSTRCYRFRDSNIVAVNFDAIELNIT